MQAPALADSTLVKESELLRLMQAIPTPSGSAVLSIELHPTFQTPVIWLIHTEDSQMTISTERFSNASQKQPELKFTMRVQIDKSQTHLLITLAKRLREKSDKQVASFDEVTCYFQAKGGDFAPYSIQKNFLEMPSDSTDRGLHKDAKEFVAWLIETTGVKPRSMITSDAWSGGLKPPVSPLPNEPSQKREK